MSETYLPVKESLGYKNVKTALLNIFQMNLDDLFILENSYEGFNFSITYRGYDVEMGISDAQKNTQFQFGEGGIFKILLDDPNYPENSILEKIFLEFLIDNQSIREKIEYTFGKNEKDIEYALQVLKGYLDKKYEEEHDLVK
ncbi:hypothetical protein D8830_09205 [Streptococcus intermedius]|uniref:hypothetical protein n=1 Tax=Streptococcus intermedius TaxID=1338 RepID=UPI000417C58D|nr:hypothetical protein [Streptococcus intermedius]RSJ16052.1 hypothetical protein D8830_09205 [Streptococcus intermedius]